MASIAHSVAERNDMSNYNTMETEKLKGLYKKSCAEFRRLSDEITAMREVLHGRNVVAEAQAKLAEAQAVLKAAGKEKA